MAPIDLVDVWLSQTFDLKIKQIAAYAKCSKAKCSKTSVPVLPTIVLCETDHDLRPTGVPVKKLILLHFCWSIFRNKCMPAPCDRKNIGL